MSNFNVSDWFDSRAKLNICTFTVSDIDFELMALTDDLIDDIKLCDSYAEMIESAASLGLSYNRKRVADDSELSKDFEMLWAKDELNILGLTPTVREQVGAEVCEISGLTDFIESTLQKERDEDKAAKEAKEYLEGDDLGDTSITLGQLESDATTYAVAV
tara:strand:- start:966 stop:1445 length:480 start_codon:yes stop_codon:yes gene_type:complete